MYIILTLVLLFSAVSVQVLLLGYADAEDFKTIINALHILLRNRKIVG